MTTEPRTTQRTHHHYYLWGGGAATVVALLGFARTFYLKTLFGTPALTPLLHLHGLVMTTWMVLFLVQTWLVASHRTRIHRRLGIFGALWAIVVLVVGTVTAVTAVRLGHHPPRLQPLVFLVIPLGDMFVFGLLIAIGLFLRNNREVHKRLMLLASLSILIAAIARIPLTFIQSHRPAMAFLIMDLIVLAFILYDTLKYRRLHPAFAWGGLLILATCYPLRMMVSGTDVWIRFASWMVR